MECERCGFVNPGGSVFCNGCGERIVVGVRDLNDKPYIVWRGLPFTFLETVTLTRFQFFVRFVYSLVMFFVGLLVFWMMGLGGLWVVIAIAVFLFWYFAWSVGRSNALQPR